MELLGHMLSMHLTLKEAASVVFQCVSNSVRESHLLYISKAFGKSHKLVRYVLNLLFTYVLINSSVIATVC